MKRVRGIIEERQLVGILVPVAVTIISIVADVGFALWWISKVDPIRVP